MHPILNIAIQAARAAGKIIIHGLEQRDTITIHEKKTNDFVSEIDHKAEKKIIDTIRKNYPDHCILSEESGSLEGYDDEIKWIVDPLDGTTNFLHGFPHFSVSIGVMVRNRLEHGVIYDPIRHDLFVASRGKGARCNNRRLRVSKHQQLKGALLGTGFPYRDPSILNEYLVGFRKLVAEASGIRRAGSAALDLAYVAAGYIDGFWEYGLQPWDIAAGILMIQEAGGLISDFNGGEHYFESGDIIAANPKVLKKMLQVLHQNKDK